MPAAARDPGLWLVRHAPVPGAAGLCYGASDWPADAAATQQAAERLAASLPPQLPVYCSPLQRCRQLAQALQQQRPDLPWQIDARLRELDFGAWEGRSWGEIGQAGLDAWLADFAHRPPAPGAESVAQLMARVEAAWQGWLAAQQPALWITHAGVIRAARLLAGGIALPASAADWPAAAVAHGEPLFLRAQTEG